LGTLLVEIDAVPAGAHHMTQRAASHAARPRS
jgi:hypothetical protein